MIYESKALSEPIRLTKNGRVLGFALNYITESNLAVWTSEGKIYLLELQQGEFSTMQCNLDFWLNTSILYTVDMELLSQVLP